MGSPDRKIKCLIGASLFVLALPVYNGLTKPYLRDAIIGNRVDCANGVMPLNRDGYPYDAIVVPGAGTMGKAGERTPNLEGQVRLKAAARLYAEGLASQVIILDGKSAEFNSGDVTSTDILQISHWRLTGRHIPTSGIYNGDSNSINTATNMVELSRISSNIRKVAVSTSADHAPRATIHACVQGKAATAFPTESHVDDHGISASGARFTNVLKEKLEVLLCLWDPKGEIPTKIKELAIAVESRLM